MNVIANYLPTLIYVQSGLNLVSVPKASAVASFFSWQFLKHSVSDAHLILSCAKSVHTKKKPKLMCLFQSTMGAFSKAPVGCLFQSTCRLNYAFSKAFGAFSKALQVPFPKHFVLVGLDFLLCSMPFPKHFLPIGHQMSPSRHPQLL